MRFAGRPDRVFRARRRGVLALREFGRKKLDRAKFVGAREVVERGQQFSELHGWKIRWPHPDCQSSLYHLIGRWGADGRRSGGIVTAHFGKDGIILCDPNRAGENADKVFPEIYRKAI